MEKDETEYLMKGENGKRLKESISQLKTSEMEGRPLKVLYALYVQERHKNKRKKKYNSFKEFLSCYNFLPQTHCKYNWCAKGKTLTIKYLTK